MDYDNVWKDFDIEMSPKVSGNFKRCCDKSYLIDLEGCVVCIECGVVDRMGVLDSVPEYCDFAEASTTKANFLFPNSSTTTISGTGRLAKISNWNSMPYDEKVLFQVSNDMKSKLEGYFQTDVIQDSISNFKKLDAKKGKDGKKEIHRGRIRDGLIAACVYFACKKNYIKKTPEEISMIMEVDVSTFNSCTKIYTKIMKQEQDTVSAVDFVSSYCGCVGNSEISFKIQGTIKKICKAVEDLGILDGSIPQNITAGCLFFTILEMDLDISQKTLSDKFSISINTLSKITTVISDHKSHIFKYILEKK